LIYNFIKTSPLLFFTVPKLQPPGIGIEATAFVHQFVPRTVKASNSKMKRLKNHNHCKCFMGSE